MMSTSPLRVDLAVSASGRGKVVVDGVDLSNHCAALSLDAGVGRLPEITLTLRNVDVEGWVEVTSFSDDVRRFIDPDAA